MTESAARRHRFRAGARRVRGELRQGFEIGAVVQRVPPRREGRRPVGRRRRRRHRTPLGRGHAPRSSSPRPRARPRSAPTSSRRRATLDIDAPVAALLARVRGRAARPTSRCRASCRHQAGLAWVDGEMSAARRRCRGTRSSTRSRAQVPHYEPGSQHGYHATTYGWLVGEVVRRVSGKSVGTYFRDEIATPLGLDFWIGLPGVGGAARRATRRRLAEPPHDRPRGRALDRTTVHGPRHHARQGAVRAGDALSGPEIVELACAARGRDPRRERHRRRPFARPHVLRVHRHRRRRAPPRPKTSCDAATTQLTTGPNRCCSTWTSSSASASCCARRSSSSAARVRSDTSGAGGSVGWADPDAELAFGYVMNRMDMGLAGDVRTD